MGSLSKVPAPVLNVLEPVAKPETTGSYYSGYKRSWKKPAIKPKPEPKEPSVAAYTSYKPVEVVPAKPYTEPVISYERPKPKVVERPKRRPYKRRNRYGYEGPDDDNYLSTYTNRYNGTKAKPHPHQSCLERMLSKFQKHRDAIRGIRKTRISKQQKIL